jgi:hypothetical protein
MQSMSASREASPRIAVTLRWIVATAFVQRRLATAGDKNPCALRGEALGGAQADARASASNDCYFVFKFPVHQSFCFV